VRKFCCESDGVLELIYLILDSKILNYDERLGGIMLAYEKLEFAENFGSFLDEQPDVLFKFMARVLIYCPKQGEKVKAVISEIQPGHATLLTSGVFPVVVLSGGYPRNAIVRTSDLGKACLANKKTGQIILTEGEECTVKCRTVSFVGGMLRVEASFDLD